MILKWMIILNTVTICGSFNVHADDPPITCQIPLITNGFVTDNNNEELNLGEALTVKCGADYELSSPTPSVCQDDRTYRPAVPTCNAKPCPVPTITNGTTRPAVETIIPSHTVSVACDEGYVLSSSSSTITCITNKIFTPFNLPTCNAQNCNEETEVPNGKITGPTPYVPPGSKLLIQCWQGYEEVEMNITCVTLDTFHPPDGINTVCIPQSCILPAIANGDMSTSTGVTLSEGDEIEPGATFTITCGDQYLLNSGNSRVECITLNNFRPHPLPQCTAQDCPERPITNGVCPSVQPGQPYVITCNENYELASDELFTCVSGTSYRADRDVPFPTECKAKDCPLEAIENGEISGTLPLSPDSTATLTCGADYQLEGNPVMTCVAGTVFEDPLPICTAYPCPVPSVDKGYIPGFPVGNNFPANTQFTIACDEPYALSSEGAITCITKKTFNPSIFPTCIRALCNEPVIANGEVTGPSMITPNSTLTIQCKTGYVMSHVDDVVCFSKDKFDPEPPKCNAQDCPRPDDNYINNGKFTPGQPGSITPGNSYQIECEENYEIEGSSIITCKSGTVFVEDYPRCDPKPCPKNAFNIPNGDVTNGGSLIPVGTKIEIACYTDYQLVGAAVTCSAGTQASGDLPKCTGYDCPSSSLPSISNGEYSKSQYGSGEKINVTCNNGYVTEPGDAKCETKNRYSGSLSSCTAQNCTVGNVQNGKVENNGEIRPGDRIEITCNEGYKHTDKTGTYICVTYTTYNPHVLPTCQAVPCPKPDIANSVISNSDPLEIGEALTIDCEENYLLAGSDVTCVSGSKFSGNLPVCQPTPCSPLPTIPDGRVDTSQTNIPVGEPVTVVCDEHYKLSHTDTPVCITNKKYEPPLPACTDKDCGIPQIGNGFVTGSTSQTVPSDTVLTVQCNPGYDLDDTFDKKDGVKDGKGTVTCVRATVFDPVLPDPTCIPQPCPIPTRSNATLVPGGPTDIDPGSTLTVRCHSRYQIEQGVGEEVVTCVAADTYQPAVPTCQAKDCPPPTLDNGDAGQQPITPLEPLFVKCDKGYDLSVDRSVTIKCYAADLFTNDDGRSWSQSIVPTCNPRDCLKSYISRVDHGMVTNPETISPGSPITIVCNAGYLLTPATTVTCTTRDGNANIYHPATLPTCAAQNCPKPNIANGFTDPSQDSIEPGSEVIYTCNEGFWTNDTVALYCVTSNQYSAPYLPTCVENCVANNDLIRNGYISGPGTLKTGRIINIECDEGFVPVVPDQVVRCFTKEKYEPEPAGCKAVRCPLPNVSRATILNPGPVDVDDTLLITCPEIYRLTTDRDVVCKSGHVFEPDISRVKCEEKPCILTSESIENGTVSRASRLQNFQYEFQPGEKLKFACNEGYVADLADTWCITHTVWTPRLPQCNARPCNPPSITGATISPRYLDSGTILTMTCSNGKVPSYYPESDNEKVPSFHCITENQFSLNPLPSCEIRDCTAPDIPKSNYDGTQTLRPGDPLQVTCDGNYILTYPAGVTSVTCLSTNYWSTTNWRGVTRFPECKAKPCEKPIIKNGIVSTLDVIIPGSILELNCGTGYVTPAGNTFKCVSGTIYDPRNPPGCSTTDCVVPDNFEHGTIRTPIRPEDELVITCDVGYAEDCEEEFTCVTGMVFKPNSLLPQCKPKLCTKQNISDGAITGPDPITPGSFLTIQCKAGKAITSHIMPKCIHTTVFEPPLSGMDCVDARNCTEAEFGYTTNGALSLTSVAPGQYAELTCDQGHSPIPENGKVYCVVGGIGNPIYPPVFGCERTSCTIPAVQNGLVTNNKLYQGDKLEIQCQSGFKNPYSEAPVRCIQGNTYTVSEPFTCFPVKECAIPNVSHGKVSQSILPIGSKVSILCDTGYFDPYNGDVRCTEIATISHSNIACQTCDKTLTNTDGVITSPLYDNNLNYPANTKCTYTIRAQNKKYVRITLTYINMEMSTGCTKDALSFYDGDTVSLETLLYTTCGTEGAPVKRAVREIESSSSVMTIVFVSDGESSGTGFSIGYASVDGGGSSKVVAIAVGVTVPLLLILIIVLLLFLYCRYWRTIDEPYAPHKNFHWKEGGTVDNAYFHFIANGGRKPPPATMANKLQVTAQLPEDETESVVSTNSRSRLTAIPVSNAVSYSSLKLNQTISNINSPQSRHSGRTPLASSHRASPNYRTNLSPTSQRTTMSQESSNFNSRELENMEKYNHKKALEGLGLSETDFKLNIPASYTNTGRSNISLTESEDDSLTRTALEDTLLDGDPLQHTVLSDEVLRSPQTMRALEKFRAGARKERLDDPNDKNYEMKRQNRILSEEQIVHQRRAYNAGYRRPLPPNHTNL